MKKILRISFGCFCTLVLLAGTATGKPQAQRHEMNEPQVDIDVVRDDLMSPSPQKVLQDTVWIADWTFDTGAPCDFTGWEKVDNHILNDGVQYWDIDASFGGTGGLVGNTAALGYENDLCCEDANGYAADWYQAIRIFYDGAGDLSFDYLVDSESGFDFLQVEEDSACASFDRVDFSADPSSAAAAYRTLLFADSGFKDAGSVANLGLTDYGTGSCVYIAFFSDGGFDPCDGLQPTATGKALVVDNIVIIDGNGTRQEDFEDGSLDIGTFLNIQDSSPFGPVSEGGSWARTFDHVTDNDICSENTSCAVLWTDFTTPSIANDASMSFGPGGFVVKNWLDDIIISPWVSLATTPTATGTLIQFRRFPGNSFGTSRMVQNWSVRGKSQVDDGMGGTLDCISGWGHAFSWNSLSTFRWLSLTWDMSASFDPTASEIQIRHRTSDWQWIVGASPPSNFIPGPGPYVDKNRIGRQVLSGPFAAASGRSQGQSAFPTEIDPTITPGTGEHFRPTTDRFGTAAFSYGWELGANGTSPNLITGDSVTIFVEDVRGAGGITAVEWYGVIASGPHAGKAPPPHSVGANGFFVVTADSSRSSSGTVFEGSFFVDLDDTYFRGGDVLHYFWLTEDALGGVTSVPGGLTAVPASVDDAQAATNGMWEVNFLPTINWDPNYLAAIDADPNGDIDPTPEQIANSSQANCILYYSHTITAKRSLQRTSFMYSLDRLGYRGSYDTYFPMGLGNTNNQLGGRATVEQAQGYNLIVLDVGTSRSGWSLPDGEDLDSERIPQATWFRNWLAQASISEAGWATLWLIGANLAELRATNPLLSTDMAVTLAGIDQGLNVNPDVIGQGSFTFDAGVGSNAVDFTTGPRADYSLSGGCPVLRDYDGLAASGTGVDVYLYADPNNPATTGDAAVVMNSNPAGNWNTILMSHPWFDIRNPIGETPASFEPEEDMLQAVLGAILPAGCIQGVDPTDTGDGEEITAPARTVLYLNRPNPFNPMTKISFDLAQSGHVSLNIYDVAGRVVRTLVNQKLAAGRNIQRVWDGMDDNGQRASSGVYFYRLEAPNFTAVRKMVMLK